MPNEITVHWRGLSDIEEGFRALPVEFQKTALRSGLKLAAEVYRNGMSERAPEDSGALKSGITYKITVNNNGEAVVRIGPQSDVFYGSFQELGTRFMKAQPFMRVTMFQDGQMAVAAFVAGVRLVFDRLIRRARRLA